MHKTLSILGSTGSIGTQTLDVISKSKDRFKIIWLTTNSKIDLLEEQCKEYAPQGVVVCNEASYKEFKSKTSFKGEILCGKDSLKIAASDDLNNLVVSALVGFSGVEPTLAAIRKGIDVALANKETLVSAGDLITKEAKEYNSKIIAVDSEHNAILQCLLGEDIESVEKLILTASGGPFRQTPKEEFSSLSVEQALNHPNWSMGSKITIDSASMMNKGLEVIEAYWLFGIGADRIDVIVHPQSIIHSMVQFVDGSTKAQMGLPDMRVPISNALTYPSRFEFDFPIMDLAKIGNLSFEEVDYDKFTCLKMAFDVLKNDPKSAVILNAANEIAVYSFLNKEISFDKIPYCIDKALNGLEINSNPSIEEIIEMDSESRIFTKNLIKES